ncbi:MAG: hypothetical protein ACI81O_000182 [Cyclobacteriaceae bacterium]|jgi:hypothetical protein
MHDFALLPVVLQASGQCLAQIKTFIAGIEQQRSAIGTGMRLIKLTDDNIFARLRLFIIYS